MRKPPCFPGASLVLVAMLASAPAWAVDVKLSGDQEMPPVKTSATGRGSINVASDGAVTGSVTIADMTATMAHIHHGAVGKNGPVIVHLAKTADNTWTVVPNAKLTPEQLAAYKAGELYVNVHSVAHQGGEVRAQITP
jgi:CHRD domain